MIKGFAFYYYILFLPKNQAIFEIYDHNDFLSAGGSLRVFFLPVAAERSKERVPLRDQITLAS